MMVSLRRRFYDKGMVSMFHALKRIFAAAMFASAMGTASFAATIPFTINTAGSSASISNCSTILCAATVELAPTMAGNPVINVTRNGPAAVFDFLVFRPVIDLPPADNFTVSATLSFLSPLSSFSTTGSGTNFSTFVFLFVPLQFTNGILAFNSIPSVDIAGVGKTTVSIISPPATAFGAGNAANPRSVTIKASISVVPLPAGVLLLGTALLGLFGLSRRRKLAAA